MKTTEQGTPVKKRPAETPSVHTETKASPFQGMQLLLVQSVACAAVLLLALVLRLIGGDFFSALGGRFREALADNTISTTVMSWFENDPLAAAMQAGSSGAQTTPTTTPTNATSVAAGGPVNDSAAVQAVAPLTGGELTSAFGTRCDPFTGEGAYHGGMDIAAAAGTPLVAMFGGTVMETGYEEGGYGNYVLVQYGSGVAYLYGHCSAVLVAQGDTVTAAQIIAEVGTTGRSTGNHVHVEWRINGQRYDPAAIVPKDAYA